MDLLVQNTNFWFLKPVKKMKPGNSKGCFLEVSKYRKASKGRKPLKEDLTFKDPSDTEIDLAKLELVV